MIDKAVKTSYKILTSFLLACTVIVMSVVYTDALQSRAESFNKKYILTGNQADDIVSVAVAQLGRKGKTFDYTEDWCVDFVSDCARNAGIPTSVIPQRSGVADMYNGLLECGAVRVSSPQKGDLVFYSGSDNVFTHMGIMADTVASIHGNVNGHGDSYTFMRTSEVDQFKYYSFRPGSPCFLRPKYSKAVSWKTTVKKVNLGNDFYARIVNSATEKALVASTRNNVVLYQQKYSKQQVWHFTRNSDGTYKIVNQNNGKALAVYKASPASDANVYTESPNGSKAQKWSIYGKQGNYILSSDCTGCVIDIYNASSADGTNFIMRIKDNGKSQKFGVEKIPAPVKQKVKISSKGKSAVFSWAKDSKADSYVLEITKGKKVYKTVSGIKSTSIAVNLPDGSYSAVLTSVNVAQSTKSASYKFTVNRDFSKKVKITQTADAIRLTWNKVAGASGYQLYQYKSGEWKRIAKITGADTVTYRVGNLKSGTTYKFRIKVVEKNGYTILGKETDTITAATKPSAPKITSASQASNEIRLNWKRVTGANGYAVYQYKSGEWVKISTISKADKLNCKIGKLKADAKYKFRVRAFKVSNGETLWSLPASVNVATKSK